MGTEAMNILNDPAVTWYGPHACETCGETIVRAEIARGGQKFNVPLLLLRIFQRGAENGDPAIAYPQQWTEHVCTASGK